MKAKEFIPASKPRNFVAKNQKTAGAGAHKDKKKAEKQGDVKHKNKMYDEGVAEGVVDTIKQGAKKAWDYATEPVDAPDMDTYKKHRAKNIADIRKKKAKQQGVAEGMFGLDPAVKGKIQNIVEKLSDEYGMWDHKAQTFTPEGLEHLKSILKFNEKYIKYALSLTADDYEAEGVAEGAMSELHAEFSDVYNQIAPNIEKHKDKAGADRLYQALVTVAKQNNAVPELKRMLNNARNSAHMDYDTNPGGFENWFWYLPLGDQDTTEGEMEGRHGYDDAGFSLAPGHDEGEPVYNPRYDRTGQYDRKAKYSQDYDYNTGKPLSTAPQKKGMYFYNVKDPQTAQKLGLKQSKSGKWYLPAGSYQKDTADKVFGNGRYWEPKS